MAVENDPHNVTDARRLVAHLRKLETLIYIAVDQGSLHGTESVFMCDGKMKKHGPKQIDIVQDAVEYKILVVYLRA